MFYPLDRTIHGAIHLRIALAVAVKFDNEAVRFVYNGIADWFVNVFHDITFRSELYNGIDRKPNRTETKQARLSVISLSN